MKDRDILNAMGGIDPELLAEAEAIPVRSVTKNVFVKRLAVIAACVCLLVIIPIVLAFTLTQEDPTVPPPTDSGEDTLLDITDIRYPIVFESMKLTGVCDVVVGSKDDMSGSNESSDIAWPWDVFFTGRIVEARVIEVLPDVYFLPGSGRYRIARIEIIDQLNVTGYPSELYICYGASYCGTDIFDGFDSFIISLGSFNYEGHRMINLDRKRVESFPDVYNVYVRYGCVMAFTDGVYDVSFLDKVNCLEWVKDAMAHYKQYPAKIGSTLDEVKKTILEGYRNVPADVYKTAEEIFDNEVVFEAYKKLMNDESSIFVREYKITDYRRSINGFLTEDIASINEETGEITYSVGYTEEDIAALPDLGTAMAELDIANMELPHLDLPSESWLDYARAYGYYRKADGKVYGIIKICWYYKCEWMPDDTSATRYYAYDYCYYLYESDGSSRMIEWDELIELVGKDVYINEDDYGYIMSMT